MTHGSAGHAGALIQYRLSASRLVVRDHPDTVNELKDRAIAHQLGISYNTLRTQLSRLYRKLGVQTRIGVAVVVFETFIEMQQTGADDAKKPEASPETEAEA